MERKKMEKKPFEPPAIARIAMLVEETVLGACKVSVGDGTGSSNMGCNTGGCKFTQGS